MAIAFQSQYNWLEQDLRKANTPEARAKQPWIVTLAHRPMYCSNNDDHDCKICDCVMRRGYKHKFYKLEDLFFNNSVDLQLYGHQHNYERSLPIFNCHYEEPENLDFYQDPKYPIHIITGAGGVVRSMTSFSTLSPDGRLSGRTCTDLFT